MVEVVQMERWNGNGYHVDFDIICGSNNGGLDRLPFNRESSPPNGRSSPKLLPVSSTPGVGYIEHPVSKLDTLAGVAIKYGVEVSDIKRMNGLVTDLQMFALKTLQIPLPGRHPPSPLSSDSNTQGQSSSEQKPTCGISRDLLDSFQSLRLTSPPPNVSPSMSSLQGYYGLKPADENTTYRGCEMAVYREGESYFFKNGSSAYSNPPLNWGRRSKSLIGLDENSETSNTMSTAETGDGDSDKRSEKRVRRRQKSVTEFTGTPEKLLKEENNSNITGFLSAASKGLALRLKAVRRNIFATDSETSGSNAIPIGLGDSISTDGIYGVRKSSSTSSLPVQDNGSSSSSSFIWSTSRWSLKPDLQVFSTSAITKPKFDGLPKPATGWRNKAALD